MFVFFDGECRLCRRLVLDLIRRDAQEKLLFAPLQSEFAKRYLSWFGLPLKYSDSLVLIEDGKAYTHAEALVRVANILSSSSGLAYLPKRLINLVYACLVRLRHRIGWLSRHATSIPENRCIHDAVWEKSHLFKKASFAAGCFWGVEANFQRVRGVVATRVGYTGGHSVQPTYQQVCTGQTGHAEAVELLFDPHLTTYEVLLREFWRIHDPTTWHQQGPDLGSQYRSAIFFHDDSQHKAALKSKKEQSTHFSQPIVTEIAPSGPFYQAEDYHQDYIKKNQ